MGGLYYRIDILKECLRQAIYKAIEDGLLEDQQPEPEQQRAPTAIIEEQPRVAPRQSSPSPAPRILPIGAQHATPTQTTDPIDRYFKSTKASPSYDVKTRRHNDEHDGGKSRILILKEIRSIGSVFTIDFNNVLFCELNKSEHIKFYFDDKYANKYANNVFDKLCEIFSENVSRLYSSVLSECGLDYIGFCNLSGIGNSGYTCYSVFDSILKLITLVEYPILFAKKAADGKQRASLTALGQKIRSYDSNENLKYLEVIKLDLPALDALSSSRVGCRSVSAPAPPSNENELGSLIERHKTISLTEVTNEVPAASAGAFSASPLLKVGVETSERIYLPFSMLSEGGFSVIGRADPIKDIEFRWYAVDTPEAKRLTRALGFDKKYSDTAPPPPSGIQSPPEYCDKTIDGKGFRFQSYEFSLEGGRQFSIWYASRLSVPGTERSKPPHWDPRLPFPYRYFGSPKTVLDSFGTLGRKKVKGEDNLPPDKEGRTGRQMGQAHGPRASQLSQLVRNSLPPARQSALPQKKSATEFATFAVSNISQILREYMAKTGSSATSFKFAPQEWCHLIAHGDGGADSVDNLSAGSAHSNTEECAIECAMRNSKQKNHLRLAITAYTLPVKPSARSIPLQIDPCPKTLLELIKNSQWWALRDPPEPNGALHTAPEDPKRQLRDYLMMGKGTTSLPPLPGSTQLAASGMTPDSPKQLPSVRNVQNPSVQDAFAQDVKSLAPGSVPVTWPQIAAVQQIIRNIQAGRSGDTFKLPTKGHFEEHHKDLTHVFFGMRRLYELMSKSVFVEIPVSLFHRYKLYKKDGSRYKLILDYWVDAQREMFDRNQYLLLYHMVLNRITGRLPESDADEIPSRPHSAPRGPNAASPPPSAAAPPPVAPLPSDMTSLVEPPGKPKMPSWSQKPNPSNGQPPSDGRGHRYSPSLIDICELGKKPDIRELEKKPMKKPKEDSNQPSPDEPMGSS